MILVHEPKYEFCQFNTDGSLSFWLRNPKVWTSETGSVVEVWSVPEKPEVDPVAALLRFMNFRKEKFGDANPLPVFIHEDGKLLTSSEMNGLLRELLAFYPILAQSELDTWTGHSFRD